MEDLWAAVEDAGYPPVLLCPEGGVAHQFDHLDQAATQAVDKTLDQAALDDAALVLPGGIAKPRQPADPRGVRRLRALVRGVRKAGGGDPSRPVDADVVKGKRLASWPSLQTDIRNAGGEWLDATVVADGNLITSRDPDDIPAFTNALLEALEHGRRDLLVAPEVWSPTAEM